MSTRLFSYFLYLSTLETNLMKSSLFLKSFVRFNISSTVNLYFFSISLIFPSTLKYNNTSMGLYGAIPSWCDYYNALLSSLANKHSRLQNLQVVRRHGMSESCRWWHI